MSTDPWNLDLTISDRVAETRGSPKGDTQFLPRSGRTPNDLRQVLMLGNARFILGGCWLTCHIKEVGRFSKKYGTNFRRVPKFETKSRGQSLGQRTLVSPFWIACGADSEQIPCPKTPKGELWLQLLVSFHLGSLHLSERTITWVIMVFYSARHITMIATI